MSVDIDTRDDGRFIVECSQSDCADSRTFHPEMEAREDTPTRSDWELHTTIDTDGSVKLHEAYCPKHRMESALKDVLTASQDLAKSTDRVATVTEKVNDVDFPDE